MNLNKEQLSRFKPISGNCIYCGEFIGSYWSKYINLDTGEIACLYPKNHFSDKNPPPHNFFDWSDG